MSDSGYHFRSSGILGLFMTILVMIALFFIAKGIFTLLYWIAPVLLIFTLVLDYQVVVRYLLMLWSLLLTRPILGLLASVLTFFGYPVVIFFLFGRAWFGYNIRKKQGSSEGFKRQNQYSQQQNDDFVAYEEITDEDSDAISGLFEINRNEPPKQQQND